MRCRHPGPTTVRFAQQRTCLAAAVFGVAVVLANTTNTALADKADKADKTGKGDKPGGKADSGKSSDGAAAAKTNKKKETTGSK